VTSRIRLLIILPLVFDASCVRTTAQSLDPRSSLCGRVVAVSCEGPSSAVTLLLTSPSPSSQWWIVIPPEYRQLFGLRIEDRYEQRSVCVPPATGSAGSRRVLVRDPDQIMMSDVQASIPLPDDVARTCDLDVRLPIPTRNVEPQYTAEAMRAKVRGSVVVRGIVDLNGAVRDVRVVQSLEPSLDDAARRAFAQWEFRPATRGGEPVAMAVSVQMAFTTR
jgi:TonB family protein